MVAKALRRTALVGLGLLCSSLLASPGTKKKTDKHADKAAKKAVNALATNPFDKHVAAAQADAKQFRASAMQASLAGTPGLWSTQLAETLAPGQASLGFYGQRYSRAPGGLVVTDMNMGVTLGVTKWLELTFASSPYRRVRLTHPEQLTFGPLGTLASFNPVAPFVRNPLVSGINDWSIGATAGILSQDRGDKVGLALQFNVHVPFYQDLSKGINTYGISTTEPSFQINSILDKRVRDISVTTFNFGYQHNGDVSGGGKPTLDLRDQFNYGIGEMFPLHSHLQGIIEFTGSLPFGSGAIPTVFGPQRPVDITGGVRVNPTPWMGLNLGYRYAAHSPTTNPSGFVFGLSFGPPPVVKAPPPPPPAPTLACSVDQATVQPGATVNISTTVNPASLPYTYNWTTTGGKLSPANGSATLDTTGVAPGMYTITARVNGSNGNASCNTQVEVREPVKNPPTASCSVSPNSVLPGAGLTFAAQASSPDSRPLTYAWAVSPASAGHLDTTTQATVHLDTTGATPGSVTGHLTVSDDRGLSASCSADANIQTPPPPPQAALATTLQFKPDSARVDNAAKAALDDVALRLQQDASAKAVIVGSATATERTGSRRKLSDAATTRLAEERAANAKEYLVKEKGIAADRIEVRQDTSGAQKAEVWVVPQGASYTGSGQTFDESALAKPAPRHRRTRKAAPAVKH